MVAAAIGGSAVLGAATQLAGGSQQQSADSQAANQQYAMYQQMRSDLMPYMNTGANANTQLGNLTGINPGGNPLTSPLLSPIKMDQATLEQTPGYQFNLSQGLKATQNAAAARGLGSSGAALKGAASYATGLADSTYQNQFSNAVTNQTNQFNRLMGLTQLGQTSAAGVGSAGITTGQGMASNIVSGGNAAAGSLVGAGNSLGNIGQSYLLNNLTGGSLFGNSGSGSAFASPIMGSNGFGSSGVAPTGDFYG